MSFDYGFRSFKSSFFDSPAVKKALNRFERKVLSKFGAFARQRIKTSIRKRKTISEPGKPPHSHEGSYRRLIFFAYDAPAHAMVVGPVKFKRGDVPKLLEFGGVTVDKRGRRAVYRPRPHVFPACREEIRRFPQLMRS